MVKIAEGSADRRKQDALYVRIGGDGRVCPAPIVSPEDIDREKQRLSDFRYLIKALVAGAEASHRQKKVISFFTEVFDHRLV